MKQNKRQILPLLLLLLALVSADPYSTFPISNYSIDATLWILILWHCNRERLKCHIGFVSGSYSIVGVYLLWALIGCIRGLFVAENYWEYKSWVTSSCIALFPLLTYAFNSPHLIKNMLSLWLRYAIPMYFLFHIFFMEPNQFYFGPVYFLACFIPIIHKQGWKIFVTLIIVFFLTYDIADQRSQFFKAFISTSIALGCVFKRIVDKRLIKLGHAFLVILPLVLVVLGITGVFNVFADTSENQGGKFTSSKNETADVAADTRTFIYYEVINSALKNDYVLMGRTTARGNDTDAFSQEALELKSIRDVKNIKEERSKNELCFLNIFTWLGLIGMLLYMWMYLRAAYLGVYKSKSFYVKMAGIVTAFNFAFGWVENCTTFDILNVTYWIFISICLSPKFRGMTDDDFKQWYQSIYVFKKT